MNEIDDTVLKKYQHSFAIDDGSSTTSSKVKPPFGYYGAKQRIARHLINLLPPHNCWVEAFCGSAAITLAKAQAPIEVINDIDGEIVNLFEQLRDNTNELCRVVALTPYSREEFLRGRVYNLNTDPLERARTFLVRTMMTVNGTVSRIPKSGFSFSPAYTRNGREARVNRWYNLPERIAAVAERFRSVRVENRDARELVSMFRNRPATLMYLDPPYPIDRKHGYVHDAKDETFHRELLAECVRSNAMLMISSYSNDLYDSILTEKNGWSRTELNTMTRDTRGRDHARIEVVWRNPWFIEAQKRNTLMLRLTGKELKENKLNPERTHRSRPNLSAEKQ